MLVLSRMSEHFRGYKHGCNGQYIKVERARNWKIEIWKENVELEKSKSKVFEIAQ